MKDRLTAPGTGLSGGQQQRLCIARAIATSPEVLLMDEPCSALDPIATAQVEELIDELRAQFSVVIVTHSMQQAARVSQKTAFFHLGNLVEYGDTGTDLHQSAGPAHRKLYHRPDRLRIVAMTQVPHIAPSFDRDLDALLAKLVRMSGLVETALTQSADALEQLDVVAAERLIAADAAIDGLDEVINLEAAGIIARRAPAASDLRLVLAVMRVSGSLERVGDLAKNVAKRTLPLAQSRQVEGATGTIRRMAKLVAVMLEEAMRALVRKDARLAADVRARDVDIDQIYNTLFRSLLTHMLENQANITASMHLHFIAKNIERAGDHATGIAEQAIYLATGGLPEEARPKADSTTQPVMPKA